jgi:hypothetical protein
MSQNHSEEIRTEREPAREQWVAQEKAEYRRPTLKMYGSVKDLTQSTGSVNGDGGQHMMRRDDD